MRVAMWYNNRDVRVEEVPTPPTGPGELLVRVEASGLCGSDALEWYRLSKAPLVLGHEIAGEVVEVGEGVKGFKVGDRVTAAHHVPCNACHYCLSGHHSVCETLLYMTRFDPGGFAEYVRVPAINVEHGGVLALPDEVSFEEASFTEPLACALRGQRMVGMWPGHSALIVGSGITGLLQVAVARTLGAGRVVAADTIDFRLKTALEFGADAAVNAEELPSSLREVNDGRLADLVVICRAAWIEQALKSVERGGTVLFVAAAREGTTIPMSVNDLFWRTEVTLTSAYAGPPADSAAALELIRARSVPVREMISHRLSLAETVQGFHLLTHPQEQDSLKVVIEPQR